MTQLPEKTDRKMGLVGVDGMSERLRRGGRTSERDRRGEMRSSLSSLGDDTTYPDVSDIVRLILPRRMTRLLPVVVLRPRMPNILRLDRSRALTLLRYA